MKVENEKRLEVVNHTKDGLGFSSVKILDQAITKALIEKIGLSVFVSGSPETITERR